MGLSAANEMLIRLSDAKKEEFVNGVLRLLAIRAKTIFCDLDSIPKEGPVIFVANHPCGMIDGLIGLSITHTVRPDVRVVGNKSLLAFENMASLVIPVERPNQRQRGIEGIREILLHLDAGNALLFYPAGWVASYVLGKGIQECPWSSSVGRLAIKYRSPIVPIFFGGRNSYAFHMIRFISQPVSSSFLLRELFNKINRTIPVCVGKTIPNQEIEDVDESQVLASLLRERTLDLAQHFTRQGMS